MTGLAVAAVSVMVAVGTPSFNQIETVVTAEAAGKVLSMEEAAEKISEGMHKAWDAKKKMTTKVTIKCPNKKFIKKCRKKLVLAVAKEELGVYERDYNFFTDILELIGVYNDDGTPDMSPVYKKGKLTLTATYDVVDGGMDNIIYGLKNMEELEEVTKGMSTRDKVKRIATWLAFDKETKYTGFTNDTSEKDVYEHKANEVCGKLASMYARYAHRLGIPCGTVGAGSHVWNWIFVDGELYHVDLSQVVKRDSLSAMDRYIEDDFELYRGEISEDGAEWEWKFDRDILKYIPDFPKKNLEKVEDVAYKELAAEWF